MASKLLRINISHLKHDYDPTDLNSSTNTCNLTRIYDQFYIY